MTDERPSRRHGLGDDEAPGPSADASAQPTEVVSPAPAPSLAAEAVAEVSADATDHRMAELLASTSTPRELRERLQGGDTVAADDLLSRCNALEFVSECVGEVLDMPERLGTYRITGLLGRGGMGTVYLAWQEDLEREVALKVLAASWTADPTMRQRFRAEARATAALHHRHIVPIYDYGEAQGRMFFAMERVDGMSLDKHIAAARRRKERPLEPREAARRFAGVADALGLAHRRRILHRDVKPGNILVAADGTLALTDFGLAKALDQGSMRLTSKSGGFLGTLHYSSPEQAMGGQLSPASDLYSLGVTMFEAVSGEMPLHGESTEAVLQSLLHGEPRRLREALPRPPRDLEAVLDKLLARESGDRYQDGEALARDLVRIADGEPVHIRRQSLFVRLWRRARKNPGLAGAIVAAAVLLFVTFGLLRVLRREQGQSLQSRHQNNLVAVLNSVRADAGQPWGPPPLLHCLVGGAPVPEEQPSEAIGNAFDRVGAEMPDDPMVPRMRAAWTDDPLPEASARLLVGRGYEALVLFDRKIADELATRSFADLSVDLRLYRLYLGRAVANLTAVVQRPSDARRDLDLASYLRPEAVFPRVLARVLDLGGEEPERVIAAIERELTTAPVPRAQASARLLWTLAGLRPAADANLMPFALGFQARRRLHELAVRHAAAPPGPTVGLAMLTGRAAEIHRITAAMVENLGTTKTLRSLAQQVHEAVGREVHPQAPLQSLCGTAQLLERPNATALLADASGQPLSPTQQLLAWELLRQVRPPATLMELLLPRFGALRTSHPGLVGLPRAAALLHAAAADAPEAPALAHAWVVQAPEDVEARLCRAHVSLRRGAVPAALDDAMVAVQRSLDRAATIAAVVAAAEAAAADAAPPQRDAIAAFAQSFRELLP